MALRLGIAARLVLSLVAVAVLAVAANLLADGKLFVLRVTEVYRERSTEPAPVPRPPVPVAAPAPVSAAPARAAAPAPVPVPFPRTDALRRALERISSAVDAGADADPAELNGHYQKSLTELDRAAAQFSEAAKAAGESPPTRFTPTVKLYGQHGGELVRLATARRQSMDDYSAHFERLNARVKKSLDHAWNIFGRVVARQSLVKLTSDLDELRRKYAEVVSADTVDPSTYDSLGASEATLAQTLTQDRGGLTRADGKDWYAKSQEDLLAMASARRALLQIDKQRKEGARKFGDDLATLSQIVTEMGKTETYDARHPAPQVPTSADASAHTAGARVGPPSAANSAAARTGAPGSAPDHDAGSDAAATHDAAPASAVATGASPASARVTDEADAASSVGAPAHAYPAAADATVPTDASGQSFTGRVGVVSRKPANPNVTIQRSDNTTAFETPNDDHRMLIFWLSVAVLVVVVCISAVTAFSILRPVRRLTDATDRIAKGESGVNVPRGGVRELDTLAQAFNDMTAQLAAAQEQASAQNELLEQKVAERTVELQKLSQLDPLTRLANRRHFFTLLNQAIESAAGENRLVGVFFVDIDNFKHMNDGLGHQFGDQLLQTIAQRLADSTHSFGFAARLGGDEFTVVYESASSIEDVRIAGLQLVKAFEEPLQLDGRELILTVSAGASVYPEHGNDAETLIRAADAALYQAKTMGRGQLALFTPALSESTAARFLLEQGLRRAIEKGEFHLVFQPEVNLHTGETELVEALLRWRLPDGRYASPGEFLGVAEASGLIFQINDWVLKRAIETLVEWRSGAWPNARVAINISSRQLFDHSFVDRVLSLLSEHKLPANCIEIELTEQVLQTGNATIAALHRLHEQGVPIALDDFGAGFSSLTSLERLPITRVKLDGSLMASIDNSIRSASIARAIILLCQDLGLSITAEGIERVEQLSPLIGYPALYAQGFLLAAPQSAEEVLRVMQTLPALTQALVQSCVARLPEAQLAEKLPLVTADSET